MTISSYHADTVALGAMASRARVPQLVLTHLIPPPETAEDRLAFEQDLRDGGYHDEVTVGETSPSSPSDLVAGTGGH